MIDLEKLRIDYERKVKEAEVANAIEQEKALSHQYSPCRVGSTFTLARLRAMHK